MSDVDEYHERADPSIDKLAYENIKEKYFMILKLYLDLLAKQQPNK
jgi:hypothetical protein